MTAVPGGLGVVVGIHSGGLSGIDTYAEQVAAAAAIMSHDVTLVATTGSVAADLRSRLASTGVRVLDLGLAPPTRGQERCARLSPRLAIRRLESALAPALDRLGETFDIAHLNHPPLAPAMRPFARGVCVAGWFYPHSAGGRMAAVWRHTGSRVPQSAGHAVKGLLHHRNDVRGYRSCDRVVAVTETLAEHLRAKGIDAVSCPAPARLIHQGAARAVSRPAGARPRLLVCSGDLGHPRKNVGAALRASALASDPSSPVTVELIGRRAGALKDELRRLPGHVAVDVLGPLPPQAVHERMRTSDALLLPSLFEEWGYVAVESALQGTPVVTFPIYPFVDMLPPPVATRAADLTIDAYAEAIRRTLDHADDRSAIAEAAEQRFGLAAVGRRLSEIWSVLGASRRTAPQATSTAPVPAGSTGRRPTP